jgi:hypothetical protein
VTQFCCPPRAPDVKPGYGRIYVEAVPLEGLRGLAPQVPIMHYLADVPLGAKGKLPPYKKLRFCLFARGRKVPPIFNWLRPMPSSSGVPTLMRACARSSANWAPGDAPRA